MRQKMFILSGLFALVVSIPLLVSSAGLKSFDFTKLNFSFLDKIKNVSTNQKNYVENSVGDNIGFFRIYDKSTRQVLEISYKDFLCNTVACEMEPTNHEEALKAQSVAAYTYFCNVREKNKSGKNICLHGADFEVESNKRVYYMGENQLRERWGADYEVNRQKIMRCVETVYGEALKKNGRYIEALYHSISSGNTESMSDVFGGACECLVAVPSPFDKLAPGYKSQKSFTVQEVKDILNKNFKRIDLSSPPENFIQILEHTDSGMVKKISIGNKVVTGREIRSAFELRSSNFEVSYTEGNFTFTVYGYGHGVGLSQYGALCMAEQGANYKEILQWYYKGVELVRE